MTCQPACQQISLGFVPQSNLSTQSLLEPNYKAKSGDTTTRTVIHYSQSKNPGVCSGSSPCTHTLHVPVCTQKHSLNIKILRYQIIQGRWEWGLNHRLQSQIIKQISRGKVNHAAFRPNMVQSTWTHSWMHPQTSLTRIKELGIKLGIQQIYPEFYSQRASIPLVSYF